MSVIERKDDDWQPRPGEPHPVDKAFYDLTVKERDYERAKVDRLEAQLTGAVNALARLFDLELVASETGENEHGQAAIREARTIVNHARGQ